MEIVILFGGGDAGGIIITANGIIKIPPFGPDVWATLKATSAVVAAAAVGRADGIGREMSAKASELAAMSWGMLKETGEIKGAQTLVYLDEDGGWCGSTGSKVPFHIPFPKPGPGPDPGYYRAIEGLALAGEAAIR